VTPVSLPLPDFLFAVPLSFLPRWLNGELFQTEFRPVPLQSYMKKARQFAVLVQAAAGAVGAGFWAALLQLPGFSYLRTPTSLKQGLELYDESLQLTRSLEVPPGWDTSKNGVRPQCCHVAKEAQLSMPAAAVLARVHTCTYYVSWPLPSTLQFHPAF